MELVGVFVIAVLVGIVFRYFGLPSIIGQVLAGFILGLSGLISFPSIDILRLIATLGVTLLLFLVGLEMNWNEIRRVGKEVIWIFLGQTVLLMVIFAVFGSLILGLSPLAAVLFSLAISFSSTVVVVKILSEKKELTSYSGRLSIGVLLLQDILAITLLVLLPNLGGGASFGLWGVLIFKLLILILLVNVVGHWVISSLMKLVIKTAEDMVLFSLAWLVLVVFGSVKLLGVSAEVGGLLAGLSLSSGWGHFQIVSKIRVLRDVFLSLFFVLLGFQVGIGKINWILVLELFAAIVMIKFMITHGVSRLVGLSGRNAMFLGFNMTQVSEFSLVVMSAGLAAGLWNDSLVKAVTMAGLFSMAASTIIISKSGKLSIFLGKFSKAIFQFGGKNRQNHLELRDHVVLFGGDRTGKSILTFLKKNGETVAVVDFNPRVVNDLKKREENVIFADATDLEVLDLTNITEAKMIISTIKDVDDSLSLLVELKSRKISVPVIVDAETISQAKELYAAGASYVIFPHFVSGWHMGQLVKKYKNDKETFSKYRKRQDNVLKSTYEGEY